MTLRRIAMLSVHTCPLATLGGKETGGMNVYVRELTRELSQRGLAVDVFTRSQNPAIPRISSGRRLGPNGRVIHLPAGPERPYDKNAILKHLPEFVDGVRVFADREGIRYDVLYSHYWLSGLAARELRAGWGPLYTEAPIVQMFHTLGKMKNLAAQSAAEMESPQRIASETEIMRFADRVIAATTLEREQMQALYGADPAKISVVPPGVDLARFRRVPAAEAKTRVGARCEHQMILFVGRIQPIKGIDTLIQAVALVLAREPEFRCNTCLAIIGGDDAGERSSDAESGQSEMARLKTLRESLGMGDLVTFLGSKDQDTLADYYSAATVVVVPSHYESFGMVALEAMACGTPVIASDVGGLSVNIAEGFNGYLVPAGDAEALADKLTLLMKHPSLREYLGDQAARWAERYSWSSIADEILAVFGQALAPLSPRLQGGNGVSAREMAG
jgi:D-inositol-3-phosphate glycosyltransferase